MIPPLNDPAAIAEALKYLTPEERRELDRLLTQNMPVWMPQVGPQTEALRSEADIIFYGGQAGGGKTDLLIGAALTEHEHSIIFRREAVQLVGIIERATTILGGRRGFNGQDNIWHLPEGRVLEFGSVKEPDDWMKYQGRAHDLKCVVAGTPVLMADGSYKPIEDVTRGNMVATLEGPRMVTVLHQRTGRAVTVKATLGQQVVAQQTQGDSHALLTASGWAVPDTSTCPDVSSPTRPRCACRSAGSSSRTCSPAASVPAVQHPGSAQPPAPAQDRAGCQSWSGSCAGAVGSVPGIGCAASVCPPSAAAPHSSATALPAPVPLAHASATPGCALPSTDRDGAGAPFASSPEGCSARCACAPHHGGEQPRPEEAAGPAWFLLRVDAGLPIPIGSEGDGLGKTPTHTRRIQSYSHPYGKGERQTQAEVLSVQMVVEDAGVQTLFDLTVDDANHYITEGGFVNRNCFDEITHFLESQFRTLIGWMRTDKPGQRQRVICAGNPPTNAEGAWVKDFWGPWLNPAHPNPAKPGELRWFISDEKGKDKEVPGPGRYQVGDDWMEAKSRTFIRSSVDDNLFLVRTGYKATLQSLPEPLRSQMLKGDFNAGESDHVWQLLPTDWVKAAMARWKPREVKGNMTALGFDVSRGGDDKTVGARRHGRWFDELKSMPGVVTKDGPTAAAFAVPLLRNGAPVAVDAIGIGSSAYDFLVQMGASTIAIVGSEASTASDEATGLLRMRNARAEYYWRMREALDPTNPEPIALPPDKDLETELCAIRYKIVTTGKTAAILVEDKDDIRKRLGRSPDHADAVAMTFSEKVTQFHVEQTTRTESRFGSRRAPPRPNY